MTPFVSAGTTSQSAPSAAEGFARSSSELPSAATGMTPRPIAYLIARSTDCRNACCVGSELHLNSVDSWNALSSTKKLMLITSSLMSPA